MSKIAVRAICLSAAAVLAVLCLSACAAPSAQDAPSARGFIDIGYATWTEAEPAYRLYPGDVLDVTAPSAPELARTVTVQPDGRITLPLVKPVMAANLTVTELEAALSAAYADELLRPAIEVSVKQSAPLKVFVGGEVKNPGVYDMPGDIDALQGVILAGGFLPTALRGDVVVVRRGPGGRPMMRRVDLRAAAYAPRGDAVPLRRFDIVYVPKTRVAAVDQFVDQFIRQTLPIQFSYAFGAQYVATP